MCRIPTQQSRRKFQSTLPQRQRLERVHAILDRHKVSIHAAERQRRGTIYFSFSSICFNPRRRKAPTTGGKQVFRSRGVSIHTAERQRHQYNALSAKSLCFNPHRRKAATILLPYPLKTSQVSIHTAERQRLQKCTSYIQHFCYYHLYYTIFQTTCNRFGDSSSYYMISFI